VPPRQAVWRAAAYLIITYSTPPIPPPFAFSTGHNSQAQGCHQYGCGFIAHTCQQSFGVGPPGQAVWRAAARRPHEARGAVLAARTNGRLGEENRTVHATCSNEGTSSKLQASVLNRACVGQYSLPVPMAVLVKNMAPSTPPAHTDECVHKQHSTSVSAEYSRRVCTCLL
jgi:hypothetical protein